MIKILQHAIYLICILSSFSFSQESFIISDHSEDAKKLFQKSRFYCEKKQWEKALECYEKLLSDYNNHYVMIDRTLFQNINLLVSQQILQLPNKIREKYNTLVQYELEKHIQKLYKMKYNIFLPQYLYTSQGQKIANFIITQHLAKEEYEKALEILSYYHNIDLCLYKNPNYGSMMAKTALCYFGIRNKTLLSGMQLNYIPINPRSTYLRNLTGSTIQIYSKIKIAGKNTSFVNYIGNLRKYIDKRIEQSQSCERPGININQDYSRKVTLDNLEKAWRKKIGSFYSKWKIPPLIADQSIYVLTKGNLQAYDILSSQLLWKYKLFPKSQYPYNRKIYGIIYDNNSIYISKSIPRAYKIKRWKNNIIKLTKTGKKVWSIHQNGLRISSAPLIWRNIIYFGAYKLQGFTDSYIIAYNKKTGKHLWKTFIGSAKGNYRFSGSLAGGNGRIYYINNLGACVCINPANGKIFWLYRYINSKRRLDRKSRENTPIILTQNVLLISPKESPYIYALNPWNGKLLWKSGLNCNLLAASANKAIIKKNGLHVFDLNTGKDLNTRNQYKYMNTTKGKGFISGKHYITMTNYGLTKIHLDTYKKRSIHPKNFKWFSRRLFSLTAINDVLVTRSHDTLQVFYNFSKMKKKLEDSIKKYPENIYPVLKLGKLYEHKKNFLKAKENYNKALDLLNILPIVKQVQYRKKIRKNLSRIYMQKAKNYKETKLLKKAQQYYELALENMDKESDRIQILFSLLEIFSLLKNEIQLKKSVYKLTKMYGNKYYFMGRNRYLVSISAFKKLSNYYKKENKNQKSIEIYRDIFKIYPENLSFKEQNNYKKLLKKKMCKLYLEYAKTYQISNDHKKAYYFYKRASELTEDTNINITILLGYVEYFMFIKDEEQLQYYTTMLIKKYGNIYTRSNYGYKTLVSIHIFETLLKYYKKHGRYKKVLIIYDKISQLYPKNIPLRKRKTYKRLLKNKIVDISIRYAKEYQKNNNYEEAYYFYQFAFTLTTNNMKKIHILFFYLEYFSIKKNETQLRYYIQLLIQQYGHKPYYIRYRKTIVTLYALKKLSQYYKNQNKTNLSMKIYQEIFQTYPININRKQKKAYKDTIKKELAKIYLHYAKQCQKRKHYIKAYEYYNLAFSNISDTKSKVHILFCHLKLFSHLENIAKLQYYHNILVEKYGQEYCLNKNKQKVFVCLQAFKILAQYYQKQKMYKKAIETYQKVATLYSEKYYQELPVWRWVKKENEKIIKKKENIYKKYNDRALKIYHNLQSKCSSSEYYKLIQLYPNNSNFDRIYFEMIFALKKEKKDEQAIYNCKIFLQECPKSPYTEFIYGAMIQCYESQKDYLNAQALMTELYYKYQANKTLKKNQRELQILIQKKLKTKLYEEIHDKKIPFLHIFSYQDLRKITKFNREFSKRVQPLYALDITGNQKKLTEKLLFIYKYNYLYCYSISTGKRLWRRHYRIKTLKPVKNNLIIAHYDRVEYISKKTGKTLWQIKADFSIIELKHWGNYIVCIGKNFRNSKTKIIIVDIKSRKKWLKTFKGDYKNLQLCDNKIIIFTVARNNSFVHLYHIKKRKHLKKLLGEKRYKEAIIGKKYILLYDYYKRFLSIFSKDLKKHYEYKFLKPINHIGMKNNNIFFIKNRSLFHINPKTKTVKIFWSIPDKYAIQNIFYLDEYIYIIGNEWRKYCAWLINIKTKKVKKNITPIKQTYLSKVYLTRKYLIETARIYTRNIYNIYDRNTFKKKKLKINRYISYITPANPLNGYIIQRERNSCWVLPK